MLCKSRCIVKQIACLKSASGFGNLLEEISLQAGEESKQKSYEAICELPGEVTQEHLNTINTTKDLLLAQTTPTRVAHRRAMLVRERMVYSMSADLLPDKPKQLILKLRTQVPQLLLLHLGIISHYRLEIAS